jgi:hypothetical protein
MDFRLALTTKQAHRDVSRIFRGRGAHFLATERKLHFLMRPGSLARAKFVLDNWS